MTEFVTCYSPIDGSVYARRPVLSAVEATDAVRRARSASHAWAARPLAERVALVRDGVARVGAMTDDIVPELAHQMGRPVRYGGEFSGFKERADYMAALAPQALAPVEVADSAEVKRAIKRVPQGVVLVVAPWNYPYMTAVNTVVPALLAGNAVLLKAASQTLLTGERMVRAFVAAGIPEDIFQNLFLDHGTTADLIAARSFDLVNFTGSVAGGQAMERAAAGTFTAVATELGGKDPAYVMDDADLDAAAEGVMDGALFNSGQCCCGIERIYVHEHCYDDFLERAVAITRRHVLGNPLDPTTTLGPMAHVRFAATVREQVDAALSAGARGLIDPADFPADDGGAYVMPQILVDVDHDMAVMREESFGPIVGVMKVRDDAEAVALMNDSDFGLTASLWTADRDRAETVGMQIETGTVFMNRCDYLDPALCWSGCKDTGRGAGLSVFGFHAVTRPKSFHLKSF